MTRCTELDQTGCTEVLNPYCPPLHGPTAIEVRRRVADGVRWLVFAAVLLTLGGLCLRHVGGAGALLGAGLLLGGGWNVARGLIWVGDRSAVLVVGAEALLDRRSLPELRIPWSGVGRVRLSRTTRDGVEESAAISLFLVEAIGGNSRLEINLAHLDHSAQEIVRLIGERANLS